MSILTNAADRRASPARILAATPVPLLVASGRGRIVECGPAFSDVFGYLSKELEGRLLADLVHPADRLLLRSCFRGGRGAGRIPELRLLHRDQIWRHVQIDWRPLAEERSYVVALEDVTERRQAEEEWRIMSGVFENALDGMAQFDSNGVHVRVNRVYAEMYGYSPSGMIGLDWQAVTPIEDHGKVIDGYVRMMTEGRHVLEVRGVRKDGGVFHRETVMITAHDVAGAFAGHHAFTRDITSRIESEQLLRRSRERLRELSGHLEQIREEERTRIAREIHDNLGQNLTGLKMEVSSLVTRFGSLLPREKKSDFSRRGRSVSKLLDATVGLVRQIASDLRPGVLDLGLAAALEWQAAEFSRRSGIRCKVEKAGMACEVGSQAGVVIFRIFQELLTNVARHAQATRVEVEILQGENRLLLRVHDDGRGITKEEVGRSRSLGLLGMHERAASISGTLSLKGSPSSGTTAILAIPLDAL